MTLVHTKPTSPYLNNYVENFYNFDNEENIPPYYIYPSGSIILTINNDTAIERQKLKTIIRRSPLQKTSAMVIGPFKEKQKVEYLGKVDVFTIVFQSYGFFKAFGSASYYLNNQVIPNFKPNKEFGDLCKLLMSLTDPSKRFELMEEYLLENMSDETLPLIDEALKLLHEDSNLPIREIAASLKISSKTLIQKFKKYLGLTPSSYKNVLRFRKITTSNENHLTQLGYDLGYFDQAHMINSFKKITQEAPMKFLKKENITDSNEILWMQ